MNVLLLRGESPSPLPPILAASGCRVIETAGRFDAVFLREQSIDFIVSYGYRHILRKDALEAVGGRAVNLHISLLPWNRGADPNLWSFLEDTPKGCTIHYIDEGVDTGDIVAQRELDFGAAPGTLASTYARLHAEMVRLFEEQWPLILAGKAARRPQVGSGSSHRTRDRAAFEHLLAADGWNTGIGQLKGRASAPRTASAGT